MTTAIDRLTAFVVVRTSDLAAEAAADLAGQHVATAALVLRVGPLSGVERCLVDEGSVNALEPVVPQSYLTEVNPVERNMACGRVLDANVRRDDWVAG